MDKIFYLESAAAVALEVGFIATSQVDPSPESWYLAAAAGVAELVLKITSAAWIKSRGGGSI